METSSLNHLYDSIPGRRTVETKVLKIGGMTCDGCARSVSNVLRALPGVLTADVSLTQGQATVSFDPAQVSVESMRGAIEDAGFEAQ
jgi:copper chaperone